VGNITVGTIAADGGAAGTGVNDGSQCSGAGVSGYGGAIWLQTLGTATYTSLTAAAGATPGGACGVAVSGFPGYVRCDTLGAAAACADANFATENSINLATYQVYSKAYDLGTLNASFTSPPTITADTSGGGTVAVSFAGSSDGTQFSDFVAPVDITQLSNKGYRYLKFKVDITTPAGASPYVSQLQVSFQDLGLQKLEGGLSFGC
jgi:hypothetical protein